ncbi:MAG: sugar isomerase domain-containing protein [Microbacteriaceae bacterium]|nr:MAG: sugar isomerase domain-containing protein [Microbacteriaceae bacterium]
MLSRLRHLEADARAGGLDAAISIFVAAIEAGGVIQAFGTGHSEAFAMEIAGRAGGLIPTNKIALRDVVLHGSYDVEVLGGSSLERNPNISDELYAISSIGPNDAFVIASNSGVNGSIVGLALLAKANGHPVVAVTSLEHTMRVEPKHASGKRLCEVADVVLDNRAPFGDATIELPGGIPVGAVSSITAAYLAQLLTIGTAARIAAKGNVPPLYISANIPGGDEHNAALEGLYLNKIRREA